jgi:hypothetical protein
VTGPGRGESAPRAPGGALWVSIGVAVLGVPWLLPGSRLRALPDRAGGALDQLWRRVSA